jgi:hypothetical protein
MSDKMSNSSAVDQTSLEINSVVELLAQFGDWENISDCELEARISKDGNTPGYPQATGC